MRWLSCSRWPLTFPFITMYLAGSTTKRMNPVALQCLARIATQTDAKLLVYITEYLIQLLRSEYGMKELLSFEVNLTS